MLSQASHVSMSNEFQRLNSNNNYTYENMLVFISDPGMLTYSSIDMQSHQGREIFGLRQDHNTIYNVEVVMRDLDNPVQRDSCSFSTYAECVDQQIHIFFNEVHTLSFLI